MTAATTTPDRAEINRRNAARSTGPRSPEGKQRSRLNAVKHGLSASIPVLPGEDPEAFRQRVDGFVAALDPRDALEHFLVERAAVAAWKIERADRAEAAQLAAIRRAAPSGPDPRHREEVAALGRWLLAAHAEKKRDAVNDLLPFLDDDHRATFHGSAGEPMHVLTLLEATADGCRWLLDRWAELRARVESGAGCQGGDLVTAILLLGHRPLGLTPYDWSDRINSAPTRAHERAMLRQLDARAADDQDGRRAALLPVIDGAVARLTERAAALAARDAADADDAPDRLAFDAGPAGELMRRYQFGCDRAFHRALSSLVKLRHAGTLADRPDPEPGAVTDPASLNPEPAPAGPVAAPIVCERSPADKPGPPPATSSDPPPAGFAESASHPQAPNHHTGAQNEPSPAASDDRIAQNEPSPAASDDRIAQNEPSPAASDDRIAQNEPSPAASDDRIAQNEPRPHVVSGRRRQDTAPPSIGRAHRLRNEASAPTECALRGRADDVDPPAEADSRAAAGWLAVTVALTLALLAPSGSRAFGRIGSGVGADPRLQMHRAAGGSRAANAGMKIAGRSRLLRGLPPTKAFLVGGGSAPDPILRKPIVRRSDPPIVPGPAAGLHLRRNA